MNSWKTNQSFLKRLGILVALLCTIMCCGLLTYVFIPGCTLTVRQILWESFEPSEYCMEVREYRSDGGSWRWMVHVQGGSPLSTQLLDVNTHGYTDMESTLNPDNLTVEQVFAVADRFCVNRGWLDCGLEFDSHFHYPKQMVSYEDMIIEIVSFEETEGNCLPYQ